MVEPGDELSGAEPPGGAASGADRSAAGPDVRELNDAREMRALAHPIRLTLLEALEVEGPMTATEAGERIGESASTCSFHLRQLEKYGFVEEAGGGTGRRRPWQLVNRSLRISRHGDEATDLAANELSSVLLHRWVAHHEAWAAVQQPGAPWTKATGASQFVTFLTLEEVTAIRAAVLDLFAPFEGRLSDPASRPEDSRAIEAALLVHPLFVRPEP